MKKKSQISLFLLFFLFFNIYAVNDGGPIPLSIVPPPVNQGGPQRGQPSVFNVLFIDDSTLKFDEYLSGFMIFILDSDENIIFSNIINESGLLSLPQLVSGTYFIRLYVNNFMYQGAILIE